MKKAQTVLSRLKVMNWIWTAIAAAALLLTVGKTSPNDPRWTTPAAVQAGQALKKIT